MQAKAGQKGDPCLEKRWALGRPKGNGSGWGKGVWNRLRGEGIP
jgi:hypothetical protein